VLQKIGRVIEINMIDVGKAVPWQNISKEILVDSFDLIQESASEHDIMFDIFIDPKVSQPKNCTIEHGQIDKVNETTT